jgi:hypothetical protein
MFHCSGRGAWSRTVWQHRFPQLSSWRVMSLQKWMWRPPLLNISAAVDVRCLSTAISVGFKIPALSRHATIFFSSPSPRYLTSPFLIFFTSFLLFSVSIILFYFILFYVFSCSSPSIISYLDSSSSLPFSSLYPASSNSSLLPILLSLSPCIVSSYPDSRFWVLSLWKT